MKPERKDDGPVTFTDWLGLTNAPRWGVARPLGVIISVALVILWVVALAAAVAVLIRSFGAADAGLGTGEAAGGAGLGAGALIAAILGAPFLIWATVIKQKTLALSETALFNDKVNAALEGLYSRRQITRLVGKKGAESVLTEWEDDIVQRNGAIDRLEGLANERPSEVPRIASMLSVYVRELSSVSDPQTHPRQEYSELVDPILDTVGISKDEALEQLGVTEDDISINSLITWAHSLKPFRTDVEKAAQTLGRLRDIAGVDLGAITIDLRGANLQGFDLKGLCFDQAKLSKARMEGVNLIDARMQGAELIEAAMEGASLDGAHMEGAELSFARMEEASLRDAHMGHADLTLARMAGVYLSAARMQGANLSSARMERANLNGVQAGGANLNYARMHGTNLRKAVFDSGTQLRSVKFSKSAVANVDFSDVSISADQINSMFGDASVTLPKGITPSHPEWPPHWPKTVLGDSEFYSAFYAWPATSP